MFQGGTKSQDSVHKPQPLRRERRAEAVSNRGPPAYQPNALPLGQTGSLWSFAAGVLFELSEPHSQNRVSVQLVEFSHNNNNKNMGWEV